MKAIIAALFIFGLLGGAGIAPVFASSCGESALLTQHHGGHHGGGHGPHGDCRR